MSPAASCTSPATLAACFLASPKARLKSEFWVRVSGMGCSLEKRCHATTPQPPKGSGNRNVCGVAGLFRQRVAVIEELPQQGRGLMFAHRASEFDPRVAAIASHMRAIEKE